MRIEETSVAPDSKKRAVLATTLEIASVILSVLLLFAAIYCVFVNLLWLIVLVPVLGIAFLLKILSIKANVSYDYTITDGIFSIEKIINEKKRKQIFAFSSQDIMRVTDVTERECNRKDKKTVVCTANDYPQDGKRFLLLESKEKLIYIEAGEKIADCLKNRTF